MNLLKQFGGGKSEEEKRSEESESQTGQETDVAEESEEEEPCEESESQTGQETGAAIVGCLGVDVMSSMMPLQQVLEVQPHQSAGAMVATRPNAGASVSQGPGG